MSISSILTYILTPIDKVLSRLIGKGFGLKDIFTLLNLAGGVAGIVLVAYGRPIDASYAVLLGFILGDSLDGAVARLTNHSNQFGTDFDTITDHLAQCITPAVIVFGHYRESNPVLGMILMFMIIAAGSIRHARNTAVPFSFHFCWKGVPRPIAAIVIFAFLNSHVNAVIPYSDIAGALFITLMSYGLLTDFPFVSHHGRKLQKWVVALVISAYTVAILLGLFYRPLFWDALLLFMFAYIFFGWIVLSAQERSEFWKAVDGWKKELELK
jgi:phosphatidylserine synthase